MSVFRLLYYTMQNIISQEIAGDSVSLLKENRDENNYYGTPR